MIKDEFGFIKKNKLIMLSVMVIMIIPFLYCVFFLKSVWDPYGDTQDLPVAVVNNDRAVQYQGKTLNVGKQTVEKLRDNKQLGWRFVSAKQAKAGMKANKYYTVVTIPANFSAHAATLLDETPKKMQLSYQTNDSLNYLSEVISGIGVDKLNTEIRANVTNAYASAIFDQIKTVGKGFKQAASGAKQLNEGLVTLDDGIDTYTVGVSKVHDGIQTMSLKVQPLTSKMKEAADGANTLSSGLNQYTAGVTTIKAGVEDPDQNRGLIAGVAAYTTGVATAQAGVAQADTGLKDGIASYTSGVATAAEGVARHETGLKDGIAAYTSNTQKLASGLTLMQLATTTLPSATAQLQDGGQTLAAGITQYTAGTDDLAAGIAKLNSQTSTMPTAVAQLESGAKTLTNSIEVLQQSLAKTKTANTTAQTTIDTDYQAATTALTAAGINETSDAYQKVVKLYDDQKSSNSQLTSQLSSMTVILSLISNGATKIQTGISNQLVPSASALAEGVKEMNSGASQLTAKSAALNEGATKLNDGLTQLAAKVPTLITSVKQLSDGAKQLTAKNTLLLGGVNQLDTGLQQLVANNALLNGGVNQLDSGLRQLVAKNSSLNGGVTTLDSGLRQLTANNAQLTGGASQLASGLTAASAQLPQLTDGVSQLLDGTTQLTDNSTQLTDGAGKLNDGSKVLATSLKSGAKQVNGIHLTSKTAKMMAAPTKTHHTYFSKVANYGHALAPYVLSLALYVGALVFNFAYPIRKVSREGGTATQWFLSKIVLGGLVATGMALVEATMIMAFGLQVQYVGLFYLFAWLFALASMYLVMFLSMWLDNPGRFVAMVLLMLQLGGAGGTFPMEITNGFYNAIHPFLPMSYSIMGFRQALTSGIAGSTITGAIGFLVGVAVVSVALLWVVMQWLQRKHLMGVSQLDDNQKLQAVEK